MPNPADGLLRSPAYLAEMWKRVAVAPGLPDDITFYSFRHFFADTVADGLGAFAASEGMGHGDLTHLENYRRPKALPEVATVMDRQVRGG